MSVTDEMVRANQRYAAESDHGDLPMPPGRHVAVVACMDARLHVDRLLGIELGEAHVIRNAAGPSPTTSSDRWPSPNWPSAPSRPASSAR